MITRGKVRESQALGDGRRLIWTSDRLSAFDRVLATVPHKGQVLNQLSAWWFAQLPVPHHMLEVPGPNSMLVVDARPLSIEVVVRGYITGVTETSLWRRYELGEREIYGYRLPEGLHKDQLLPEPLITPTTKGGPTGHDERLSCAQVVDDGWLDPSSWERVQGLALQVFSYGQRVARERGLVLVDSKYEFGRAPDGQILLIDEVHTPDSSRFWDARTGASLDKEFVRQAYADRGYRGQGEPPTMPTSLWEETSRLYIEVYERLTGRAFEPLEEEPRWSD